MIFQQLLDYNSHTYTYILGDSISKEAIIIDPVNEKVERDSALIRELQLELKYILETHIHADHITGSNQLLKIFPNAQAALSKNSGIQKLRTLLSDHEKIYFGNFELTCLTTPGHTSGCMSYSTEGKVFTGDALLIRGCGRTDFQQGSSETLFKSVHEKIYTLPDDTIIYPGHDYNGRTTSTILEEKNFNPRLKKSQNINDFVKIMSELKLDQPKKIDVAVPANLLGGE